MILLNAKGQWNLHTHTKFCDGHGDPRDIVEQAIALGFTAIGFSGHEYAEHDLDACMSLENLAVYNRIIRQLQEEYKGRIQVFCGIERDYYGAPSDYEYDYVIGSVHYVKKNGCYICVDDTPERLARGVEEHYDGDYLALVEDYFKLVADVQNKTHADIIGHFDLVTKFNRGDALFSESSPRYWAAAAAAALAVAARWTAPTGCLATELWTGAGTSAADLATDTATGTGDEQLATDGIDFFANHPVVEINTGGIARGYRDVPYPDAWLRRELEKQGACFLLSSDCHDGVHLNFEFDSLLAEL